MKKVLSISERVYSKAEVKELIKISNEHGLRGRRFIWLERTLKKEK